MAASVCMFLSNEFQMTMRMMINLLEASAKRQNEAKPENPICKDLVRSVLVFEVGFDHGPDLLAHLIPSCP